MAARSRAKKAAAVTADPTEAPKPTAATREADKEEKPHVFRVDLGQSLPTPRFKTATDKK